MNKIGQLIATCYTGQNDHPIHNQELHRYLVREYGIGAASEALVAAAGQIAFGRRRHLLAFRQSFVNYKVDGNT